MHVYNFGNIIFKNIFMHMNNCTTAVNLTLYVQLIFFEFTVHIIVKKFQTTLKLNTNSSDSNLIQIVNTILYNR